MQICTSHISTGGAAILTYVITKSPIDIFQMQEMQK